SFRKPQTIPFICKIADGGTKTAQSDISRLHVRRVHMLQIVEHARECRVARRLKETCRFT
ncbi:hypothetical protein X777_05626, partial [Ooceraea biroi]